MRNGTPRIGHCPTSSAHTAILPTLLSHLMPTAGLAQFCGKELLVTDMLGFHQVMAEDSAPDSIATDYMGVHETLLLFTGIRHYWEKPARGASERFVCERWSVVHSRTVFEAG